MSRLESPKTLYFVYTYIKPPTSDNMYCLNISHANILICFYLITILLCVYACVCVCERGGGGGGGGVIPSLSNCPFQEKSKCNYAIPNYNKTKIKI